MQEPAQIGSSILGGGQDLYAVARAQNHAFIDAGVLSQALAGVGQTGFGNRQPLAHLHRCAVVVHADELQLHEEMNLCTPLK